jgi:hypothetical protein
MKQSYIKDSRVKFSELELKTMDSIVRKDGGNILPEEVEFINKKYQSIFGYQDLFSERPVYKLLSDILIQPAHRNGIHPAETNPFITKQLALEYAMKAPDKISESEFQEKKKCSDGSYYIATSIYQKAA